MNFHENPQSDNEIWSRELEKIHWFHAIAKEIDKLMSKYGTGVTFFGISCVRIFHLFFFFIESEVTIIRWDDIV